MFIDARLDHRVAFGFSGGPEYNTLIVNLANGREQRNRQWLYPRHRYSAQYSNFLPEARDAVLAAYHACAGRLHAFRFRDHNDYIGTGEIQHPKPGTTEPLQLVKTYAFGGQETVRLIQAPVPGTFALYCDGAPVAGDLDYATGIFTPATAWPVGTYTADFEFDVWVRFDNDYNAFAIGDKSGGSFVASSDIDLLEVRR